MLCAYCLDQAVDGTDHPDCAAEVLSCIGDEKCIKCGDMNAVLGWYVCDDCGPGSPYVVYPPGGG